MATQIVISDIPDYLQYCKRENIEPRLHGPEAYYFLRDNGYLDPWVAHVRVMYTGSRDQVYAVDDEYQLVRLIDDQVSTPESPDLILDIVRNPDGWEVSGLNPRRVREGLVQAAAES